MKDRTMRRRIYSFEESLRIESEARQRFETADAQGKTWYVCKPGNIALYSMESKEYAEREAKRLNLTALSKADYEKALEENGMYADGWPRSLPRPDFPA